MNRVIRRAAAVPWIALLSALAWPACRDANKDTAVDAAGATPELANTAEAAASGIALAATVTPPPLTEPDTLTDGGLDAGRKRRRLVADGGLVADSVTTSVPTAEDAGVRLRTVHSATPMVNDEVYGASAASGAPVLKKKPLLNEDPWSGK